MTRQTNKGVILLTKDDDLLWQVLARLLRADGYQVLEAADGHDGLAVADRYAGAISLVVADAMMPRVNGRQLAERIGLSLPRTPILLMSGYFDDAALVERVTGRQANFLAKPFTPEQLLRAVSKAIEQNQAGGDNRRS